MSELFFNGLFDENEHNTPEYSFPIEKLQELEKAIQEKAAQETEMQEKAILNPTYGRGGARYWAYTHFVETHPQNPDLKIRKESVETYVAGVVCLLAFFPVATFHQVEHKFFNGLFFILKDRLKEAILFSETEYFSGLEPLLDPPSASGSYTGWDPKTAFHKAVEIICGHPDFIKAWQLNDRIACWYAAEKILFLELPPNAALSIKRYLEMLVRNSKLNFIDGNSRNTNSVFNKLQLQIQGQEMYNEFIAENKAKKKKTLVKDLNFITVIANNIACFAQAESTGSEEQQVTFYLVILWSKLRIHYKSRKPLPLDQRALKWDTSDGWTCENALKEALQLVFDDPSFITALKEGDELSCYMIAEKILFLQLPPNALLAITKDFDKKKKKK